VWRAIGIRAGRGPVKHTPCRPNRPAATGGVRVFELTHIAGECPGRWQRVEGPGRVAWRCSHCGVSYGDGVAVRFAVLREYDLELILLRLVREGRRLLTTPPGGSRPPRSES
jgi:hypothetical protein